MRAGRQIRMERQLANENAKPCPECGHPHGQHFELPYEIYSVVNGAVTITPNPDYEALVFHCNHDGCECKMTVAWNRA